jgi:Pyridoxamine 5'-phosphate oxidase
LSPWSTAAHDGTPIGEIWYERPGKPASDPSLLLKLLFTSEPLSIQVHPNDAYAHSIGLPSGKTEAWYVLSAAPGAKVAIGLDRRLTQQQLRQAVDDGYEFAAKKKGLLPWKWASDRLKKSRQYSIATTRPDGAPHLMIIWGLWFEDSFWFSTGAASRKARNLAENLRCISSRRVCVKRDGRTP